jgi:Domain of unknown function (DUF4402)
MNCIRALSFPLLLALSGAAQAQTVCLLCADAAPQAVAAAPALPLNIDIQTTLDFSIAAHTAAGAGTIAVDPQTGERKVSAGLIGLGGPALRGVVTLTGQPFRRISISVPRTISLTSSLGAKAEVSGIQTTLSADPMLDAEGKLVFSFGGTLTVVGEASGDFHGQIRISADYQ